LNSSHAGDSLVRYEGQIVTVFSVASVSIRCRVTPTPNSVYEAENAELVRRVYRQAGVAFENVWEASPPHS